MRKIIPLFLFFLMTSGCSFTRTTSKKHEQPPNAKEFLSTLDSEERFFLEYFFRGLIQEDSIGYVLLGGKPMGFYSYLRPKPVVHMYRSQPLENMDLFFSGLDEEQSLFHKGWEIWKKYAPLFCGRNLFFDFFEHDLDLHYAKVSVINKRLVLSLLYQHFDQFKELDPSLKDRASLFNALINNENVKRKWYSRHDLIGICLGYGQKNAALFQRMSNLLTSLGELNYTPQVPSPDRLKELEEKWITLEKSFNSGLRDNTSRKFLFSVGLGFRVNRLDPDTAVLTRKYTDLRKQLTQTYCEEGFLQKTLELIILADRPLRDDHEPRYFSRASLAPAIKGILPISSNGAH